MTVVWPAIRGRLLTVGIELVVLAAVALLLRPSIHLGPTAPYQDPVVVQPYEAHLVTWQRGSPAIAGWSRNNTFADCPSLVIWVRTGGREGYIGAGPVAADQPVGWSGWLHDVHGDPVPITTTPLVTPSCQ